MYKQEEQTLNPYEAERIRMEKSGNLYYTPEGWNDAVTHGTLDSYILAANKLGTNKQTYDTFYNDWGIKYLDNKYINYAAWNYLTADKTKITHALDANGKEINISGLDDDTLKQMPDVTTYTDYAWAKYLVTEKSNQEKNRLAAEALKESQKSASILGKIAANAMGATRSILPGFTEAIDGLVNVFQAPIEGLLAVKNGNTFDEGFRQGKSKNELTDKLNEYVIEPLENLTYEFEQKYGRYDYYGNKIHIADFVDSVGMSFGRMLPTIISGIVGGKVIGATNAGDIARTNAAITKLGKTNQALFYVSVAENNITEMLNDENAASLSTFSIVTNSYIREAVEYVIENQLGKFLGTSVSDEFFYGFSAVPNAGYGNKGSVVLKLLKSQIQEGTEELFQDYGTYFVDKLFSAWYDAIGNDEYADIYNNRSVWNVQTAIDSFASGFLMAFIGSTFNILSTKRVTSTEQKLDKYGNTVKDSKGNIVYKKFGKLSSYNYKSIIQSLGNDVNKLLSDTSLSKEERTNIAGGLYTSIRSLTQFFDIIGDERTNNALQMLNALSNIEFDSKSLRKDLATEIKTYVSELYNEYGIKKSKETEQTLKELSIRDSVERIDVNEVDTSKQDAKTIKTKELFNNFPNADSIIITQHGQGSAFVENENGKYTLIIPKAGFDNWTTSYILRDLAEQKLIRTICNEPRYNVAVKAITNVYSNYMNTKGNKKTTKKIVTKYEAVAALFTNSDFAETCIIMYDKVMTEFISSLTQMVNNSVKVSDIYSSKYKQVLEKGIKSLTEKLVDLYKVLPFVNNWMQYDFLTKEQKQAIYAARYTYDLVSRLQSGEKLSENDLKLLKVRVNASTLGVDAKKEIISKFENWDKNPKAAKIALNLLAENQYGMWYSMFDDITYPVLSNVNAIKLYHFLKTNGTTISKIVNNKTIMVNGKRLDRRSYYKQLFEEYTSGEYTLEYTEDNKIIVKELNVEQVKNNTFPPVNEYSGLLSSEQTVNPSLVSDVVSEDIKNVLTIDDIIQDNTLLSEAVKDRVLRLYGKLTSNNVYKFLKLQTIVDSDGTKSVSQLNDGTYIYTDVTYQKNMLSDNSEDNIANIISDIKNALNGDEEAKLRLQNGYKISDFIDSKYLENPLDNDVVVYIDALSSGFSTIVKSTQDTDYGNYSQETNAINIRYNYLKDLVSKNDDVAISAIEHLILHEFVHAIQVHNSLNPGFMNTFKQVFRDNKSKKAIMEDVEKHAKDLIKDVPLNEREDYISYMIYKGTGEANAQGIEYDTRNDYPVFIVGQDYKNGSEYIKVTAPWGSVYEIGIDGPDTNKINIVTNDKTVKSTNAPTIVNKKSNYERIDSKRSKLLEDTYNNKLKTSKQVTQSKQIDVVQKQNYSYDVDQLFRENSKLDTLSYDNFVGLYRAGGYARKAMSQRGHSLNSFVHWWNTTDENSNILKSLIKNDFILLTEDREITSAGMQTDLLLKSLSDKGLGAFITQLQNIIDLLQFSEQLNLNNLLNSDVSLIEKSVNTLYNAIFDMYGSGNLISSKLHKLYAVEKDTEMNINQIEEVFNEINTSEQNSKLSKIVFGTIKKYNIPINFKFTNNIEKDSAGTFTLANLSVKYNYDFMMDSRFSEENKARVILHEAIHAVTVFGINLGYRFYTNDLQSKYVSQFKNIKDKQKYINMYLSVKEVLNELRKDENFKGQYGLTNEYEAISELTDDVFSNKLKSKNLIRRIVDAILNFFGIKPSNAYDALRISLIDIITKTDYDVMLKSYQYGSAYLGNYYEDKENTSQAKKITSENPIEHNEGEIFTEVDETGKEQKYIIFNGKKVKYVDKTTKSDTTVKNVKNVKRISEEIKADKIKQLQERKNREQHVMLISKAYNERYRISKQNAGDNEFLKANIGQHVNSDIVKMYRAMKGNESKLPKEFVNLVKTRNMRTLAHINNYILHNELNEDLFNYFNRYIFKNTHLTSLKQLNNYVDNIAKFYAIRAVTRNISKQTGIDVNNALSVVGNVGDVYNNLFNAIKTDKSLYRLYTQIRDRYNVVNVENGDINNNRLRYRILRNYNGSLLSLSRIAASERFLAYHANRPNFKSVGEGTKIKTVSLDSSEKGHKADQEGASRAETIGSKDVVNRSSTDVTDEDDIIAMIEGTDTDEEMEDNLRTVINNELEKYFDSDKYLKDSEAVRIKTINSIVDKISKQSKTKLSISSSAIKLALTDDEVEVLRMRTSERNSAVRRLESRSKTILKKFNTKYLINQLLEKHPNAGFKEDGTWSMPNMNGKVYDMDQIAELDKEFDAINSEFKAEMYLTAREKRYKTVAEKAENVANTYKVELERARTKPPVEKIVTKTEYVNVNNTVFEMESNKPMPDKFKTLLDVVFKRLAKTKGNFTQVNEMHTVKNYQEWIDDNAEVLSSLTDTDANEILDYILNSVVTFAKYGGDDMMQYEVVKMFTYSYIYQQAELGVLNIDPVIMTRIEDTFKTSKSTNATLLAISKQVMREVDPVTRTANALARKYDIVFLETDVLDLKKALTEYSTNTDVEKTSQLLKNIDDVYNKMYSHVLEQYKGNKRSILDKIWKFQRAAMLSSPGTWVRNITSNLLIRELNTPVSKLGQFVFNRLNKVADKITERRKKRITAPNPFDFKTNDLSFVEHYYNYDVTDYDEKETVKLLHTLSNKITKAQSIRANRSIANEYIEKANKLRAKLQDATLDEQIQYNKDIKTYEENASMYENPAAYIKSIENSINALESFVLYNKDVSAYNKKVGENPLRKTMEGQYKIVGTVITPEVKSFIQTNLIDNKFLAYIKDGLNKYNVQNVSTNITTTDGVIEMIRNSVMNKVFSNNQFDSKYANKIVNAMFEHCLSDDKFVTKSFVVYLGKILVEDKVDITKGLTNEVLQHIVDAYTMAAYDYMHTNNFITAMEKIIHNRLGEKGYFIYKQLLPFASASMNWFTEFLRYSPLGMVKALKDFFSLEQYVSKLDSNNIKGEGPSGRFGSYLVKRNLGKGIVGSILWLTGALLGAFGVIKIRDDDDDKIPKIAVGDVRIDLSDVFVTNGLYWGLVMGSAVYDDNNDVIDVLKTTFDIMFEDSLYTDLADIFEGTDGISDIMLNAGENIFTSFIPNILKTFSSAMTNGKVKYNSGMKGYFERIAVQTIPGLAKAMPKKRDIYTGELQYKYYPSFWGWLAGGISKFTPIKIHPRKISEYEKEAIINNVHKSLLTGRYEDIGKLNARQVDKLNEIYGKLNKEQLDLLLKNKKSYKVYNEKLERYETLYYRNMNNKQKESVINRIMTNNAKYSKIYVWTSEGNKYYATSSEYSTLAELGIVKNVYKSKTSKFIK